MQDIKVKFVEYNSEFLNLSWEWLNDPEIKEMTMTPDFTKEQQKLFYKSLSRRNDYKIWGMKIKNESIGVVGLKNITNVSAEYFGYIGNKEYWGKGISKEIFKFIHKQMKIYLLKDIYLYVSNTNDLAVNAYKKNGFHIINNGNHELLKMRLRND